VAVTITSTVLDPDGAVALIDVSLFTANVVAGLPVPKSTADAAVKPVPPMVTEVPTGPVLGLTLVTVGAGGGL
jgi:hypothetical protein